MFEKNEHGCMTTYGWLRFKDKKVVPQRDSEWLKCLLQKTIRIKMLLRILKPKTRSPGNSITHYFTTPPWKLQDSNKDWKISNSRSGPALQRSNSPNGCVWEPSYYALIQPRKILEIHQESNQSSRNHHCIIQGIVTTSLLCLSVQLEKALAQFFGVILHS